MTLIRQLDQAAQAFAAWLPTMPGAAAAPMPDWLEVATNTGALRRKLVWRNTVVTTTALARLHVEYFAIPDEIAVLHVCAFPHLDIALPIFGFDVITGRERATGCFLDLSPTVPMAEPLIGAWGGMAEQARPTLGTARVLPEWTAIFSRHVVAMRPDSAAAFEAGLAFGRESLAMLLAANHAQTRDVMAMEAAQHRYITGQRQNDRTRRMLAACIGTELADAFIAECLFPLPHAMAEG